MTALLAVLWPPLLLTCLIEGAVMWLIFRRGDLVLLSVPINILTNPALNLILLQVGTTWAAVAVGEAAVAAAEALWYARFAHWDGKTALLVSLCLNAASFGTGLIIGVFAR